MSQDIVTLVGIVVGGVLILAAWFDQTLLIRGKDAEIARLTECLRVAGLQCFMSTGKPEEVANHMASIAKANTDTIDRLTAENAALRERCGRLADLANDASSGMEYIEHAHGRLYGVGWDRVKAKRALCDAHNDLAPQAKEKTDG